MSHPLLPDIKNLGYEELERRHQSILSRMQKMRAWGQTNHEMWNQLQYHLETLDAEKQERLAMQENRDQDPTHVVIDTDPIPDDQPESAKPKPKNKHKQYTIV
jgi:hypothetical protein